MYDLINIFETFLPQLLLYPNPTDPLNGEAARLLLKDSDKYNDKVKEYVKLYASDNLSFKVEQNGNLKTDDKNKQVKEESNSEASELSNASVELDDS